jgi:hypothetical protein
MNLCEAVGQDSGRILNRVSNVFKIDGFELYSHLEFGEQKALMLDNDSGAPLC